jgi:hypothetical protein
MLKRSNPLTDSRLPHVQSGAALLVMLALIGVVFAVVLVAALLGARAAIDRDQQTSLALGKAREALVARAAGDANRPGSLPCPDVNNDGESSMLSGDWTGSACTNYVGRLPWKYLDLPDLRDGYGERLWYALSDNFRDNPYAGVLNSETLGNFTVTGDVSAAGVIAIVFSPGPPLATQNRSGAGIDNVANYLDGQNADGDNTYELQAHSGTFHDQLLLITRDNLFPAVQRRVAREVRYCLERMAGPTYLNGRYPWAAPMSHPAAYNDAVGTRFGRIPQTLDDTEASAGITPGTLAWPASAQAGIQCFDPATWWGAWQELILYHVSPEFDSSSAGGPCGGTCLTVNATSPVPVGVIVAGRTLSSPDQSARAGDNATVANYLETANGTNNADGPTSRVYVRAPARLISSPGFNDTTECVGATSC